MSMIPIIWGLSDILALLIGIGYIKIWQAIKDINERLDNIREISEEKQKPEEPKSVIIDPTDFEQQVRFEQEEMRRKLNDVS